MRRAVLVVLAALVVACFAIACSVAGAPKAVPTRAPEAAHERAVVIAASDDFAVYRVKSRATNLNAGDFYGGELYAVSSTGDTRALATFTDGPRGVELVRDTVVQEKNHATENSSYFTVHYLDLMSGREGTLTLSPGDAELAAAPGGFVRGYRPGVDTSHGEILDLELESYSGATRKIGTPYPDGRVYSVVAGDSGLVALTSTSDDQPDLDATIRYMSWSRPGVWKTIYDPHKGVYLFCARPSTTSVSCSVTGVDSNTSVFGLISLRTGKAVWLTKAHPGLCGRLDLATYGSNLVAIETADTASCTDGTLIRFGADGSFAVSSRRYGGLGSIAVGLGRILVSSGQQREIYALTGVERPPRLLARA